MRRAFLLLASVLFALCSYGQTTYTIDPGFSSKYASQVDFNGSTLNNGAIKDVWIDLAPWNNPTSSAFITGLPGFENGWAMVSTGPTYQVTYTTATYAGKVYSVPQTITLAFVQVAVSGNAIRIPPNPLVGTAVIQLGNYTYTPNAYRCGACDGWHWAITGGTITVMPGTTQGASEAAAVGRAAVGSTPQVGGIGPPYPQGDTSLDPECHLGTLIWGAYPMLGIRMYFGTFWYGYGCWEVGAVIWEYLYYPLL